MTNETLLLALQGRFEGHIYTVEEPHGMLTVETDRDTIIAMLTHLKEDEALQFNFLTSLTVVHYPMFEGREFCVVYHCHAWQSNTRLRLKVYLPTADPSIPTATTVHLCANWLEREAYDFYGVNFIGHPNLVRILNMDEMDYFPMRKEYTLEDPTRADKVDIMFGRDSSY